jgi:DNA polymerase-3 subunit gamma/tau
VALVEALVARQSAGGLEQIHQALDSGSDPRQFARQIVDYLRNLLLIRMGYTDIDETPETRASMARHAQVFDTLALLEIIQAFNQTTTSESKSPWQPALPLEMAWVAALDALAGPAPESSPATQTHGSKSTSQTPAGEKPKGVERPAVLYQSAPIEHPSEASETSKPQSDQNSLETPTQVGEQGLTIQKVEENWRKILAQVGQISRSTQTALNSCKPYGIKDGTLYLGFNGDFAKNKMEEGNNIEITRKVMLEVLGVDVPLRCFVARGERGKLPPEVEGDGMVAAVLRDLGGEIVDVQ